MKVKEFWHISPEKSEFKFNEIHNLSENEVLVKSLFSSISIGTERLVALKSVPTIMYEKMKVPYMDGSFSLPCKYGYSLVGKVIEGPVELINKVVHVMHPHQDFAIVNIQSIKVIDDMIPAKRCVLVSNVETTINAIWDSKVTVGDKVLIAGFGIIGALTSIILKKIPGVKVYVSEINPSRRSLAQRLGFELIHEVSEAVFDLAFNSSASQKGLQLCIDSVGNEGKVIEVSWYGNKKVSLSLGEDFHSMRKKIQSSQVSVIPGDKLNRWSFLRRKDLALELLKDEEFDLLVENVVPFSDAPAVFSSIRDGTYDKISAVFSYD